VEQEFNLQPKFSFNKEGFMSVPSCTYTLAAVNTYATPEKAIEGILKETEETAKQFSPDTRQKVERNARALAETARQIITNLATELHFQINQFPNTEEQAMCSAIRQTWETATTMRTMCMNTLAEGAYAETLKKVDTVKTKIGKALQPTLLSQDSQKLPQCVQPKPLSQRLQKLTGKFPNF
jgi:hypothetical protein